MQVVVVKFLDSTIFDYWAPREQVDKTECSTCLAVGLLVRENNLLTTVALLCSDDKELFSNWINIPTTSILSCEMLKEIDWMVPDA